MKEKLKSLSSHSKKTSDSLRCSRSCTTSPNGRASCFLRQKDPKENDLDLMRRSHMSSQQMQSIVQNSGLHTQNCFMNSQKNIQTNLRARFKNVFTKRMKSMFIIRIMTR